MRIGAVSYLNTKPLIEFWQGEADDQLVLDLPSRLADRLKNGELDLGLIPAVKVFQEPDFVIVPNAHERRTVTERWLSNFFPDAFAPASITLSTDPGT